MSFGQGENNSCFSDKSDMNQTKTIETSSSCDSCSEGLTSTKWKDVKMSEQEVDLIIRMYKLVGNRWRLIAGRIPGRSPEVIEKYWLMKHGCVF